MNNTLIKYTELKIDSSPPVLKLWGLENRGVRLLYVHKVEDLSQMSITLDAIDAHSGIKSVKWYLGTSVDSDDIGTLAEPVNRHAEGVSVVLMSKINQITFENTGIILYYIFILHICAITISDLQPKDTGANSILFNCSLSFSVF